jgi:hypothetical protein
MSFSWMKPTTVILSRALISALSLSVAMSSFSLIGTAQAIQIGDDTTAGEGTTSKVSYAQEYSELKEKISSRQETIDDKQGQVDIAKTDLENLKKYDKYQEDSKTSAKYGSKCDCSPKNQCSIKALIAADIITDDQLKDNFINTGKGDCDGKPGKAADANGNPPTGNRTGDYKNGSGGPEGKDGKGCITFKVFGDDVDAAAVCVGVYNYTKDNDRGSGTTFNRTCVEKARQCGQVKYLIDKDGKPDEIKALQDDLDKLLKLQAKDKARLARIKEICPHCTSVAEAVDSDKPTLGDYIVNGLHEVMPIVGLGIQAHSYNQYTKASLGAQQAFYNSSIANCQAYISQGTTLGVPSSPCGNSLWSGGAIQPPGGYAGIYGTIGGGVGGMYGYPGGYAAGYGSYGYGQIGGGYGQIGGVVGAVIGGGYGQIGGGYGQFGGGYGQFGGGYGQIGGGYGQFGGGYGQIGGGYGQIGGGYGQIGGGYGQIGGGYGQIGGGYGQIGGGIGGYSPYGQIGGGYVSTMGIGGAYGYGANQLAGGQAALQQNNLGLAAQQVNEVGYRYQQIAAQGGGQSYGAAYGIPNGYGGYVGYGGYGAQGGYGYPSYGAYGGQAVIGGVIGSLYGLPY